MVSIFSSSSAVGHSIKIKIICLGFHLFAKLAFFYSSQRARALYIYIIDNLFNETNNQCSNDNDDDGNSSALIVSEFLN